MEYILLVVGFVLLVKGADFFVEGSSSVAKLLRVPSDHWTDDRGIWNQCPGDGGEHFRIHSWK